MAITIIDILTAMFGIVLCVAIAYLGKMYVEKYCADNPTIIWIWLDDDDDQHGGIRVKEKESVTRSVLKTSPLPCM